jgi:TPR repeat protein
MMQSSFKPISIFHLCAIVGLLCSLTIGAVAKGKGVADYKKGLKNYDYGIKYKAFPYFQRAAREGNAKAMFQLGMMYVDIDDDTPQVRNNYEVALQWFQKSTALGNTMSMNWIGHFYEWGIMGYLDGGTGYSKAKNMALAQKWYARAGDAGDAEGYFNAGELYNTSDPTKALYWFKKAVMLKHRTAILWIENLYKKGKGIPHDNKEAVQWFRQVADTGNTDAMLWLGDTYRDGNGVEKSSEKAIAWYQKAGDSGDVNGYIRIGDMYLRGKDVKADPGMAEKWFQEAADKGDTFASVWVGNEYLGFENRADKKFPEQAIRWYKNAIAKGNTMAGSMIGMMYSEGDGVPKNEKLAKEWFDRGFDKAAQKQHEKLRREFLTYQQEARPGNAQAMYMMGQCFRYGIGVKGDDQRSFEWYKKAAFYGDAMAMWWTGYNYLDGRGVKKDVAMAMQYFQMAAISGNAEAMNRIGWLYDKGTGVDKNEETAKRWWLKAAQHGSVLAIGNLNDSKKKDEQ